MYEENLKNKVLSGLFWKVMENGGTQGIQFLVSILLARLLTPAESGEVMLIMIFITIGNVFVQSGFNTSLIQKQKVDEEDYSSAFYISFGIALALFLILFFAAPAIATFYGQPLFRPVLRTLSVTLFFGAVTSVQSAAIARTMEFRKLCIASISAALGSGVIGVGMAFRGYGVWALAMQQFFYSFFLMVSLSVLVSWRPRLLFSVQKARELFSYGWKILCSGLIDTIFTNVYGLVIGKIYNPAMMGQYSRGNQFPALIANNLGAAIQSVMLPAFSACQDDREKVKNMVRRSIVTSSYLVFPMMAGLMAVAEPMVKLLLTDRYLPCVPMLRLLCIAYATWPLHVANLQAINALGRSEIFLKLEIIKKAVSVTALIISIPFGIYTMVALRAVTDFICTFINAHPNKKLLNYSFYEQWKDVTPSLLISAAMGIAVYGVQYIIEGTFLTLIVQILVGILVYAGLSWLFRLEAFVYLLNTAGIGKK
ncbi:lipopolysaccharide biosynthesis protein [Lacrimispora algidixylanolytica]|uniref:Lipopolysaccharide biosynthesis protein n=1 Tax=Lacrimispora algidixylanolytica TaxID=94868 RepID=A0A419TBL8_9FIRM|nr:lipopolysaccharide biosynthesis protein [Lacrimispora algidixylanolytica]RKD34876.1 lipopolysaccharide biosynthesis protein [Lacrimispora algidixylanolytica]